MSKTRVAFCIVLMIVLGSGLLYQQNAFAREVAVAFRAVEPPVIDGDLSEWDKSEVIAIDNPDQVIRNEAAWDGPDDGSAYFYVMWDDDNLYLAATIYDDAPFIDFVVFELDGKDAIGLYLSTDPTADPDRALYDSTDFRVLFALDGYDFDTAIDRRKVLFKKGIGTQGLTGGESVLVGYEVAVRQHASGFDLEMKIPFENFSNDRIPLFVPEPGMEIGFDLEFYDLDMPCPGDSPAWLAWHGKTSVDTPKDWGILRFVD